MANEVQPGTEFNKAKDSSLKAEAGDLLALLEITAGGAVAVVGCGGKTSLIELIAALSSEKRVLVSATAKAFPMTSRQVILCDTLKGCVEHKPQTGIQCLGIYNERNGKLGALPEQVLTDMTRYYDLVLMEADGSRCLPCKGWRRNEPVVYDFCTHTVGVVTMDALGKAAAGDVVHNLSEFLSLTGLSEGEIITVQALVDMVCLSEGMFRGCAGQQYLLVNRAEDESAVRASQAFLQVIKARYPGRFKRLLYGSVHRNTWYEVV